MNDMICIIFNITYYVSKQQKAGYVSFSNNIHTYSLGRKEENTKKCSLFMVFKLRVLFFFWDLFFFVIFYEISLICKTSLWNNSLTCLLQISENKCERNCYLFSYVLFHYVFFLNEGRDGGWGMPNIPIVCLAS